MSLPNFAAMSSYLTSPTTPTISTGAYPGSIAMLQIETLTDRIGSGPVPAGHRLVDHDHPLGAGDVLLGEPAAGQQGDLQRARRYPGLAR